MLSADDGEVTLLFYPPEDEDDALLLEVDPWLSAPATAAAGPSG